jgi:hypothetical protein
MFEIKTGGRSPALSYGSMIDVILDHFGITGNDVVPKEFRGKRQILSIQTLGETMDTSSMVKEYGNLEVIPVNLFLLTLLILLLTWMVMTSKPRTLGIMKEMKN